MLNLKNVKLPKQKKQNRRAGADTVFTAIVKDMASDGRAVVAHPNGIVYFVRGAWLGEKAQFEISNANSHPPEAVLKTLITPSPERVEPVCQHFGATSAHCGGCSWQFISYQAQLNEKKRHLLALLSNALSTPVKKLPVLDVHPSDPAYGYRNRAQFKTDGQKIGFLGHKTNQLVAIERCPVVVQAIQTQLDDLQNSLPNNRWLPTKKHPLTTLNVDETTTAQTLSINERLPFKQGNSQQNTFMQAWLRQILTQITHAEGTLTDCVELFSGGGNFTHVLSEYCQHVRAYEGSRDAVMALRQNYDVATVDAQCVDLFELHEAEKAGFQSNTAQLLVLDPPRAGFKHIEAFVQKAKKLHSIVYISCDTATFTRDARHVQACGFHLEVVQPVDQFPQTPHVEVLAYFKKQAD